MKMRRRKKMNQYKQEYVTEFAYILGTMQKLQGVESLVSGKGHF